MNLYKSPHCPTLVIQTNSYSMKPIIKQKIQTKLLENERVTKKKLKELIKVKMSLSHWKNH